MTSQLTPAADPMSSRSAGSATVIIVELIGASVDANATAATAREVVGVVAVGGVVVGGVGAAVPSGVALSGLDTRRYDLTRSSSEA